MPSYKLEVTPRHTRHVVHQPAILILKGADGNPVDPGEPVQATVIDLSFSGIRVACDSELPEQATVGLQLLKDEEPQDEVAVIVRWSKQLDAGGYHHGMQFAEPGALLPLLGLDRDEFEAQIEHDDVGESVTEAGGGKLLIQQTTRLARIERLHCNAQSNLEIEQGLRSALLEVEGELTVAGGGVIGGETRSSMRMELDQAGDTKHTATTLTLAYLPDEIVSVRRRAQKHLDHNLEHVKTCKAKVESFEGKDDDATHDAREQTMALMFEMQEKEAAIKELSDKIELLDSLIARKTCGELSVKGTLYPGVRIGIFGDTSVFEVTKPIEGPTFIHADAEHRLVLSDDKGEDIPLEKCDSFKRCA